MKTKSHILSVNMSEWRYHLNINHLKLSKKINKVLSESRNWLTAFKQTFFYVYWFNLDFQNWYLIEDNDRL